MILVTNMTIYIFIDESGTLPDTKDKFVVLAAVATDNRLILNRFLEKSKKEIKFYSAGDKTRKLYLTALAKESVSIFTLSINKNRQKISDSPENYAVLSWLLLLDCLAYFRNEKTKIIFDRHFHRSTDEKKFISFLKKLFALDLDIASADSAKNPGVMAADMVAGSFLYNQTGKNNRFYRLLAGKIISEKTINWKEAKKKFIEAIKKLARTGTRAHPKRDYHNNTI